MSAAVEGTEIVPSSFSGSSCVLVIARVVSLVVGTVGSCSLDGTLCKSITVFDGDVVGWDVVYKSVECVVVSGRIARSPLVLEGWDRNDTSTSKGVVVRPWLTRLTTISRGSTHLLFPRLKVCSCPRGKLCWVRSILPKYRGCRKSLRRWRRIHFKFSLVLSCSWFRWLFCRWRRVLWTLRCRVGTFSRCRLVRLPWKVGNENLFVIGHRRGVLVITSVSRWWNTRKFLRNTRPCVKLGRVSVSGRRLRWWGLIK